MEKGWGALISNTVLTHFTIQKSNKRAGARGHSFVKIMLGLKGGGGGGVGWWWVGALTSNSVLIVCFTPMTCIKKDGRTLLKICCDRNGVTLMSLIKCCSHLFYCYDMQ